MAWSARTKAAVDWGARTKATLYGLATEDLLSFLTTEDDEVLVVEPTPGGTQWRNREKS